MTSLFSDEELEKVKNLIPYTVKRRMFVLNSIVEELKKRPFKTLDQNDKDDLEHVMSIVQDLHPEANIRTVRDYAKAAIRLWKKVKSDQ
ncbi:MAG: hypothetical protein JRN15_15135 [Nitrososphaerota archaeon]|jgi:hypothetical protein|nr:hypothetical protein [Nitrososphaerota archaeon]